MSNRALSAVTGVCLAAVIGATAGPAEAAVSARVEAGTLRVVGDGASDRIALRLQDGAPGTLLVDAGTAQLRFDRQTFAAIDVDAGLGADEVRVDERAGAFADERITIAGGGGNDTLLGGSGNELLFGGDGDDAVDGNGGDDAAALGAGDDRVVWDAGDGSDSTDGEAGNDLLTVNGSDANDRINAFAVKGRLQVNRDFGATSIDTGGVERVGIAARRGFDIVNVDDLAATEVSDVDVDLGGGDNTIDSVIARGTQLPDDITIAQVGKSGVGFAGLPATVRVLNGEERFDNLSLITLGGDDTIAGGVGIVGPERVTVEGGDGADTMTYRGTGAADDAIALEGGVAGRVRATAPATSAQEAAVERFVVQGQDGADVLAAREALAGLTLDGGAGDDTLSGGDGADLLVGGSGNDTADGNGGDDIVASGSGNDRVVWDDGDGSDRAAGDSGTDVLDVNGTAGNDKLDFSSDGPRARVIRTEAAISIEVDDIERAAVSALGGPDVVIANDLTGTDLKTLDADLGAGDGQPDTVVQRGTGRADAIRVTRSGARVLSTGLAAQLAITGSEPANDALRILTLAGDDDVAVAADVRELIATIVDLGEDE